MHVAHDVCMYIHTHIHTLGTKIPAIPHLISTGLYINCFGNNSAKWKRRPLKPAPKERAKNFAQDMYNVNLLDPAMERDPSDNVTK
jgi:hypothetical protein